jgi:hypothetical protein
MSSVTENGQNSAPNQTENGQKSNDKEYNFAQIRQQLEKERSEKNALMQELEKTRNLAQQRLTPQEEDDVDDEPYVDHKRLKKELGKVVQKTATETDNKIQQAVNRALSEERQKLWLKNNPDFYEIMNHAQAFADKDPELAETILEMPDGFERQKLVYKSIKAMGLHKPPEAKSGIQDKIEANKRSPYYQPSGVASPGYGIANGGKDYSESEGKNAYAKMQELKKRLRI